MISLYWRGRLKRDWRFQTTPLPRGNGNGTYSGLTLNQYGVASPCRTICTVCGFVALS
nr:hypothetical protein [Neisseria mucosa]